MKPQLPSLNETSKDRLPIGAEPLATGGVRFRVWANHRERVEVVIGENPKQDGGRAYELAIGQDGYFSATVPEAKAGDCYLFRLDGKVELYPDPASRYQPEGPLGPSQIVDPWQYPWQDAAWPGIAPTGQVLYEMHVGTFTKEGRFASAAKELEELATVGITVIELMPVADFAGRFGWGYDGVNLFAPTRLYGTPDELRRFVDRSHAVGIGVILDVVYNHLGPTGQYLDAFSEHYFADRHKTDWGRALNFDGDYSGPVRDYFLANAAYWIDEFHLDGLRIDATQNIYDASEEHILAAIGRCVRAAANGRGTLLIAENEPQDTRLVRSAEHGGYGLDALWNDDFHHTATARLSGRREAYYYDYLGTPQEFISTAKYGLLYQGQRYQWQKKRRGTPSFGLPPTAFVNYIQNHDQIANSARGMRCHELASAGCYRAMTAVLLLGPATPLLFQGQEFAASTPFYYFADHAPGLARTVYQGRVQFLSQFPSVADPKIQAWLPDPADPATLERCKLDLSERVAHQPYYALHRDLLRLRREDSVFGAHRGMAIDGAVLGPEAFVLRFFGADGDDRLLLVNFGVDLQLDPAPEPLLAPPAEHTWHVLWSSEDPVYGGSGTPRPETDEGWMLPGHVAVVMRPEKCCNDPAV
jgi:maltooligosyltrehalose trehalohydrolase